jgi:hypothetical protein
MNEQALELKPDPFRFPRDFVQRPGIGSSHAEGQLLCQQDALLLAVHPRVQLIQAQCATVVEVKLLKDILDHIWVALEAHLI